MKTTVITKLSILLVIFMAISLVSCTQKDPWADAIHTVDTELGVGEKTVTVDVCVKEHIVTFTIHTDAESLGEALLENGLIEGEDSQYGLFVKTVNGMTLDPDDQNSYWAFYVDGDYAMSGVDSTEIDEAVTYQLAYTKG